MKGKEPNIRLRSLYLPVRCIIYLIWSLLSSCFQCGLQRRTQRKANQGTSKHYLVANEHLWRGSYQLSYTWTSGTDSPAVLALVKATVSNHIGKKYMTEKLQLATRKFWIPMRTGIFWRSRKGARTGSGASRSSKRTNMMNSTPETMRGAYTDESPHWKAKPCFSARNAMQETDSLHVDHCICYSERPGMRAPVELSINRSTSVIHNLHTEPRRVKLPP